MSLGRLGNYDLLERIGEGGMGVVFRAHDVRLDRMVAVKVLSERHALDVDYRTRLLREARTEARLNHPNIATCFDVGEAVPEPSDLLAPGAPGPHPTSVLYLAMELVPGNDLADLIDGHPLPVTRVLDLGVQIAAGLESAHRSGVVHRDLKPGNVRVTPEGRAKILDFGLARHSSGIGSDSSATTESTSTSGGHTIVGTVLYMSPEQAAGRTVDARSDLFSFGVVLYELVTGRRPFGGGELVSATYALANEQPAPMARFASHVPEELERIVGKLLAKLPSDRYQSAHEVLTDLQRLQKNLESGGNGVRPVRDQSRAVRAWIAATVIAAAVGIAMWMSGEPARVGARGTPSLAVLGFENATGDSSLAYLCAGLAADLAGDLVQDSHLNVSSSAEVQQLRTDQRTPRTAARRLGVRSVLTGALRRLGGITRLQVELVDGRTGFVNWSAGYDLEPEQAFVVKQQIATAVASSLGATRVRPRAGAATSAAPSAAAYEEYLRGIEAMGDLDDPGAPQRASDAMEHAVAMAPGFALAWTGRSQVMTWRYAHEHDASLMKAAESSADRAFALAPDLIAARMARARVYRLTSRLPQAIAELDAVLRQNPNLDEAWSELADACRRANDFTRAEACLRQAIALRPGYSTHWHRLGNLMLRRGRLAEARAAYRQVIELLPDENVGYVSLASVELSEGRFGEAAAVYAKLPKDVTDAALASNMATAYFYLNRMDEALKSYLLAVSLEPRDAGLRANLGDCNQRMGRTEQARDQYRAAVQLERADLQVSPADAGKRSLLVMYLAKSGDCAGAQAEYQRHRAELPDRDAEVQHALAKAFALCGRRAETIAALRKMAAQGAITDLLRSEDEFGSLRSDPSFVALFAAKARVRADSTTDPRR